MDELLAGNAAEIRRVAAKLEDTAELAAELKKVRHKLEIVETKLESVEAELESVEAELERIELAGGIRTLQAELAEVQKELQKAYAENRSKAILESLNLSCNNGIWNILALVRMHLFWSLDIRFSLKNAFRTESASEFVIVLPQFIPDLRKYYYKFRCRFSSKSIL